jgi:myo-inositol 2-dehydrogenase/D-chiro-inositol 1-dehydrogenase
MRIGIIGVGRIGALHAETLRALAEVDELVVVDADTARARQLASKMGVPWAEDADQLLHSGADGIVVATPTDTHAPLICAAVEAGVAVFCEKPVAGDVAGTKEVVRVVGKSDVQVQIGFQRRFDAGFVSAREQVQAGKLGWLHTIRAGTLDPAPPPASYLSSSGGIFRDCSVHDIDAVRWVTGREVSEVYATGSNRGASFFSEAGDVDTAAALATLDDGTLALISATRYNAAGYDVRLELLGSQDSISVGLDDRLPLRSAEAGVTWPAGTGYTGFMDRFRAAYVAELQAFVEVVSGRATSPCSPADALETFYVAEACELSRRERRPVSIEEVRL